VFPFPEPFPAGDEDDGTCKQAHQQDNDDGHINKITCILEHWRFFFV
jgi:hypothetical protein